MLEAWRQRVQVLKRETYTLYLAYKDPRVPWYTRLFMLMVVGYAFSPIDLIPDFIPILGYLDDLIIVPLGVTLALKMVPVQVLQECRVQAQLEMAKGKPQNRLAGFVIVTIWALLLLWLIKVTMSALG